VVSIDGKVRFRGRVSPVLLDRQLVSGGHGPGDSAGGDSAGGAGGDPGST
jgi:hypothetical protein